MLLYTNIVFSLKTLYNLILLHSVLILADTRSPTATSFLPAFSSGLLPHTKTRGELFPPVPILLWWRFPSLRMLGNSLLSFAFTCVYDDTKSAGAVADRKMRSRFLEPMIILDFWLCIFCEILRPWNSNMKNVSAALYMHTISFIFVYIQEIRVVGGM